MLICCLLGVGLALVCENVCYWGVAKTALAAGHGALRMSVNAEHCKEIYDRLQTPGIKHNAKLRSGMSKPDSQPFLLPRTLSLPLYFTHISQFCHASVFRVNVTVSLIC